MKKIKVMVDAHVLDGKHQGTSSYISGLYSALSKRDELELYVATEKQESMDKYFGNCSNINWIKLNSKNKYQRLAFEFDSISQKLKPEFSHFQYITPLIKRNKWINTIHDILFMDFPEEFPLSYRVKNHLLFRLGAIRSDILLTVSEYSKQRISQHFKIPINDIVVTPNAINDIVSVIPKPMIQLEGQKFFVYVSRFEPRKNQHTLIEAFYRVNFGTDVKLVLVGAPALEYPALEAQLKINMNNQLIHLQGIDTAELVWLYKHAMGAFYPSKCEGFGIPPLEASALDCPSYCADNTALSELSQYVSGCFDNNVESIAEQLQRTYTNTSGVKTGSKADLVVDNYNWKKSGDILIERLLRGH